MIYWKHSFNFLIFCALGFWLYTVTKYFNMFKNRAKLTVNEKSNLSTVTTVTWVLVVFAILGAIISLLEMLGVVHKNFNIF